MKTVRQLLLVLVALALAAVAAGCGASSHREGGGSNAANTQTSDPIEGMDSASTSSHRVEHNEGGLSYPPPDRYDTHRPVSEGTPFGDFEHSLKCRIDTTRAHAAGMIVNHTSSTNDYSLKVNFYPKGNEYLGNEFAHAYVQVYGVAPGERVEFDAEGPVTGNPVSDLMCAPSFAQRFAS